MAPVKAHVLNGYFVSDEPANLPEGTPVELQVVTTDPWADMDPEERAELEAAIEEGYRDIENGDVVDAREVLAELRANQLALRLNCSTDRRDDVEHFCC